ncbi:hypothetical protein GCM10025760_34060 [Microbacterium yannicii]|uniref:DUF349 domain-containing protein n=1 Tax=Microbacterium yannicii TaxID=671622 RepID=A0ABP9MLZ3_9MICO|nr:DUF349 domain-containing protein [Microbacterium yannicii]
MTAAADFQPETDAENPATDETETPAVDDVSPTADAVEDAEASADGQAEPVTASAAEAAADEGSDDVPTEAAVEGPEADAVEPVEAVAVEPAEADTAEPVDADTAEPVEADAAEPAEADAAEPAEADAAEPAGADAAEPAEVAAAEPAKAAAPTPPVPTPAAPSPAAPRPRPVPKPAAAKPAVAEPAASSGEPWGRVDDDGTVSVREAGGWRVVGQYPDGSPEEALAYFERKYADLASEVTLLEVRHRRGGASVADLRATARTINGKLEDAAAVGDLAGLVARVAALTTTLAAESETEAVAAREAVDDAVKARTELVEKAEALAARDPRTVQWKQATSELNTLFDEWQSQQQNGPRLPKSTAQQLWKRFRDARAIVDKHRRAFYAELDEAHKGVRDRKTRLVERAEALAPKGEDGIPAYRDLLDEWKTAGRAGKKVDDALWARFKAAGDALYGARIERETADLEASREKVELKRALLDEAKAVADERDIAKARAILTGVQRRWDEVGRIFPRDTERALDDELRRIENGLRSREEADWKRNDPAQKARANDMTRQLTDAIRKLEDELEAAQKSGDKRAIADATDALEARRTWLKALGG